MPDSVVDFRNVQQREAFPAALRAMKNVDFCKSSKFSEMQHRCNREGADERIVEFSRKLIVRCASLYIPMYPHTMVRTYDDQMSAVVRGVSKDWPNDGKWPHRFAAVDIVHCKLGWMDKPAIPHAWDVIGHLGKEVAHSMGIKIVWGGDYKRLYDPAHWELEDWRHMLPPDERPAKPKKAGNLPSGLTFENKCVYEK